MADFDMSHEEREAFLADLHVGILSIQRDRKGPLALPIWYQYDAGQVIIHMSGDSVKATLLRRHGRASLTVQNETPPYQYVMVEGPVTVAHEGRDILPMAVRYLGDELGRQYADANPSSDVSVVARLTPERWLSTDYGKGS
jgi:PPOX class probable F420-dependent enzyme